MRDPFVNYDAWLERPYVEAEERADAEAAFSEWQIENTVGYCSNCGYRHPHDEAMVLALQMEAHCPKCKETFLVDWEVPSEEDIEDSWDSDDRDYDREQDYE